jgi:hypothetical protein
VADSDSNATGGCNPFKRTFTQAANSNFSVGGSQYHKLVHLTWITKSEPHFTNTTFNGTLCSRLFTHARTHAWLKQCALVGRSKPKREPRPTTCAVKCGGNLWASWYDFTFRRQHFVTMVRGAYHWSLSQARSIQSTHSKRTSLRCILILFSQLCLRLLSGIFPSGIPTKTLYVFLMSSTLSVNPSLVQIFT